MMEQDIIYKSNGEVEHIQPKNGKDYQLEELQSIVGGYIQMGFGNDGNILVMDEEGKLKGKAINEKATAWYREHVYVDDVIVGDVLLCKADRIK